MLEFYYETALFLFPVVLVHSYCFVLPLPQVPSGPEALLMFTH